MSTLSLLALVVGAATVNAASLTVSSSCSEPVLLFTQTSSGSIRNLVTIAPGASPVDMGISSDWIGAINTGTGCNDDGSSCTTGGPFWDGQTPFSRVELNFGSIIGSVTYDLSVIYGYNVGMKISTADSGCDAFACTISGCPVPGPDASCYSPCCSSAAACGNGALATGGCVNNAGPGPYSPFYDAACPNAYAFPDNDGSNGYTPKDFVLYTCGNTDVTLALCTGTQSSSYTS